MTGPVSDEVVTGEGSCTFVVLVGNRIRAWDIVQVDQCTIVYFINCTLYNVLLQENVSNCPRKMHVT